MTPHNQAKKEDIAKIVIMPGDPLRAKYIVENFFDDFKLVNEVRGMFAYTGTYKGKVITVMASGMGMPSMGIYSYELFKFYDVETIIRVGSCGAYNKDINLLETILVEGSYTPGNYANNLTNDDVHFVKASNEINDVIIDVANNEKLPLRIANIACTECFDPYISNIEELIKSFPKDKKIIGAEMESFSLFYNAKVLNKKAACLLTVVDSIIDKYALSSEERQKSLNDMIKIALETSVKLT